MHLNLRSRTSAIVLSVATLLAGLSLHPDIPLARAGETEPPFGRIANTSVIAAVTGIEDTETEVLPLTTTFNVSDPNGGYRYVEFTAVIRVSITSPGAVNAYLDIDDDFCIPCVPIRLAGSTTYLVNTGGAGSETMVIHGTSLIRHSRWTARIFVKRVTGTGSINVSQTSGTPMTLLVNDLGGEF